MASNPLTHHEILTLVESFTRSGRQVDLAATDRAERRLVFKPREYPAAAPSVPVLTETLILENPRPDLYRLTRQLTAGPGEEASLRVEGRDPDTLVDRLDRIDQQVHFRVVRGVTIARSYRLAASSSREPGAPARDDLILTGATADLGDLTLSLEAATRGPVELFLTPKPERVFAPPEDLLAVLGWNWKPLRRHRQGWRSTLGVARNEPRRTHDGEQKLARTVEHLARTLSATPAQFHARHPAARWGCFARRIAGISIVLGALALGPIIMFMDLSHDSVLRMLAFNAPPILMFAMFAVREIPLMTPPSLPGPLPDTAWVPVVKVPRAG